MDDEIDLRRLLQVPLKHRVLVGVFLLLGLVGAYVFGFMRPIPASREAHITIGPGRGTGDLYSNALAIAVLLTDPSFRQQTFRAIGADPAQLSGKRFDVWTTVNSPGGIDLVRLGVVRVGGIGPAPEVYARALADELVRQGAGSVEARKQAMLGSVGRISDAAQKLMASDGQILGQALARRPGGVPLTPGEQVLELSALASAAQGLTNLSTPVFQIQKETTLQMIEMRPPAIIGDVWTAEVPPRPQLRIAAAMLMLGVVVGVALAFVLEAVGASRRREGGLFGTARVGARSPSGAAE